MKKILLLAYLLPIFWWQGYAQTSDVKNNAIVLPNLPKLQRNTIVAPTTGQLIYDTNDSCLSVFITNKWVPLKTADINSNSTQMGNTFNGPNQLVKLDAQGNITIPTPTVATNSFIAATLLNSWINTIFSLDIFGNNMLAGYVKNDDVVTLRGTITGSVSTAYTTIFILPPGFRPSETLIFLVGTGSGSIARVDVSPNGEVVRVSDGGSNTVLYLNKINFRANGN